MAAFPNMLSGLAQAQYYNANLAAKDFAGACAHLRNLFEGAEYYRKNLTVWNNMALQKLINKPEMQGKSIAQCFQQLVTELCRQQFSLHPDHRTQANLCNKVVTACQGVPACLIGVSNPSENLAETVNRMQSSIEGWEHENPGSVTTSSYNQGYHDEPDESFFTDRKYYDRGRYQSNNNRERVFTRPERRENSDRRGSFDHNKKARCYVCSKESCRSWKHPEAERAKAKDKYMRKLNTSTRGRLPNDRLQREVKQHLVDAEEEDESDNELFEAMCMEINTELGPEEPTPPTTPDEPQHQSVGYLTQIGVLTPELAIGATKQLANNSFLHKLTSKDAPSLFPSNNPFQDPLDTSTYQTTTGSRYTEKVFQGIVVDTGASTKSTAGFDQYMALKRSHPEMNLEMDTATKGQVNVIFGVGSASSLGSVTVPTPVGDVEFHIVEPNTPFLLCLADMDRLKSKLDVLHV